MNSPIASGDPLSLSLSLSLSLFLNVSLISLRKVQRHHKKRPTGNLRFAPHLFDWAGPVEKVAQKEAKGQINQNPADLLSLVDYLFVGSIRSGSSCFLTNPATWPTPHLQSIHERRKMRKIQILIPLYSRLCACGHNNPPDPHCRCYSHPQTLNRFCVPKPAWLPEHKKFLAKLQTYKLLPHIRAV